MADSPKTATPPHAKYDLLIAKARANPPMATAVAHPCDAVSLESAVEGARMGLLKPILVGPPARIREVAAKAKLDISGFEIVESRPRPSSWCRRGASKP
jgi:phosphate acetyltransferase